MTIVDHSHSIRYAIIRVGSKTQSVRGVAMRSIVGAVLSVVLLRASGVHID
jgi:hypothetical protein